MKRRRKKIDWDGVLRALILLKIGQDLGTYTPVSKALHDVIEIISKF